MRLRVFVSSTYYDLKHLRSSLESFIESLGFDAVLSEKGDIAYAPDIPLDESCYREVQNADIFVLIIGGRYGSPSSKDKQKSDQSAFYDRYNSITKGEYDTADNKGIPIYILIDSPVYAEYRTFLRNKSRSDMEYAFVDSANIYYMIEEILAKPLNNPVQSFERFSDIQSWLKEQWSGYFRELIRTKTEREPLMGLKAEVDTLSDVTQTLKRYLETLMSPRGAGDSDRVIDEETRRLEFSARETIRKMHYVNELIRTAGIDFEDFIAALKESRDLVEFTDSFTRNSGWKYTSGWRWTDVMLNHINDARRALQLPPFPLDSKNKKGQPLVSRSMFTRHISAFSSSSSTSESASSLSSSSSSSSSAPVKAETPEEMSGRAGDK